MEAGRGGIWAVPLLTPLTSQVVSDTSEASATARQTAATAWRQVICSGKGRDSDREHSGSGREHSSSGSGSGSGSVCARALSPPALCAPLPSPARAPWPHTSPRPAVGVFQIQNVALYRRTQNQVRRGRSEQRKPAALPCKTPSKRPILSVGHWQSVHCERRPWSRRESRTRKTLVA